jgi:hypothetical protein
MKTEQTECPETSAYKIQTLGNYPEESIKQNTALVQHLRIERINFIHLPKIIYQNVLRSKLDLTLDTIMQKMVLIIKLIG